MVRHGDLQWMASDVLSGQCKTSVLDKLSIENKEWTCAC
jgi:hypothetical protein